MKECINKSLERQALQRQAGMLLPVVTRELSALDYQKITHQRLSQQYDHAVSYQGLTRAQHSRFGLVMIKWQLSADAHPSDLNHDIQVLCILQHQTNSNAIAPPLLATDILHLQLGDQSQLLTLLVMPFYSKGSLANYLKQSLTTVQRHQLIIKIATLIKGLHNAGWSHGDIKPSNFLISNDHSTDANNPRLLLTDFALAKPIDSSLIQYTDKKSTANSAGTPAYLAPECWQGQSTTMQSDIYTFGIMLYEILMSERPFKVDSQSNERMRDWAIQHCQQPIQTLPIEYQCYQSILNKALAKRVEARYLSMGEVLEGLDK